MGPVAKTLDDLIGVGWNCNSAEAYDGWQSRVRVFLREVFGYERAQDFSDLFGYSGSLWKKARESQIGMLEGIIAKIEAEDIALKSASAVAPTASQAVTRANSKKVFVVHGHDGEAKESVARFLEHLGLSPIILHEQANEGRTLMEKFDIYSDVGYAVVLLTPDDVGATKNDAANLKMRARQNVVLELGYFMGKLKRSHVCALFKAGVEIPSDYQGVLYIELDPAGAWRAKLAQELTNAGIKIDISALLGH